MSTSQHDLPVSAVNIQTALFAVKGVDLDIWNMLSKTQRERVAEDFHRFKKIRSQFKVEDLESSRELDRKIALGISNDELSLKGALVKFGYELKR